ncbi:MAG: replication initiator protein A [Defluviitaleaceae bacterium]|nr:replication initiator protein A [Defluviitaleaceae bacterium]
MNEKISKRACESISGLNFDYHYGTQADQYAFLRIPRALITEPYFKSLSMDAKVLYGLMLDRMELSMKNGWLDNQSRVFIFYTLEDIQETMSCGHNKGVKLLAELDTKTGIGLIERVKQGQGKLRRPFEKPTNISSYDNSKTNHGVFVIQ